MRGKASKADVVVGVCYRSPSQDESTNGQATQEDYRGAVCHCRGKICMAKTRLELKQARNVVDNKKGF
ncbi:hypothetical protein QYF61_005407 [Mycteria americana]|uniref:Uncharacterized protein n=1 Tax=Mycteria americana TaxID=33587 RepID=A0AAN7NPQ0_MYCAM|nr:hypothetical protein QYF61_005407 [Mycteria americana]